MGSLKELMIDLSERINRSLETLDDIKYKSLMFKKGTNKLIQDQFGCTPLHYALFEEQWELLEQFLKRVPEGVNTMDLWELSIFHIACAHGDKFIVCELLDSGAKIDHYSTEDHPIFPAGFNALHFAILYNRVNIVELLLQRGANVNSASKSGQTALHIACRFNNYEFIHKQWVKKHKLEAEIESRYKNQVEMINLLLDQGANIEAINKDGLTPLLNAFIPHYRSLIAEKYSRRFRKNNLNFGNHHVSVVKNLINKGASINARYPYRNSTILHLLGKTKNIENKESIFVEIVDLLIRNGADVNARDEELWTPLHVAIYYKCKFSPAYLKVLLRHGADLNARTGDGSSSLTLCLQTSVNVETFPHSKIIELLRVILPHAQMHLKLGLPMEKRLVSMLQEMFDSSGLTRTIERKCTDELSRMKLDQVDDKTTLYRLLRWGRDGWHCCLDESKLRKIMKDFNIIKKYPLYAHLFQLRVRRARLMEFAKAPLALLVGFELPILCSEEILANLTDQDLRNLVAIQQKKKVVPVRKNGESSRKKNPRKKNPRKKNRRKKNSRKNH